MPYIQKHLRDYLVMDTPGQLNYELHMLIDRYILQRGDSNYTTYNDIIGALECVKQEIYRRMVAPLEDIKIEENGDVPPYINSPLCKPKENEDDCISSPSTYQFDSVPADSQPGFWTSPQAKDDCAIDLKKHCEWYGLDSDDAKSELQREIDALKPGWWLVSGIRHHAYVKAIDAHEAIEIAHEKDLVDKSWESPIAHYKGKELPNAFGI